MNSNTLLRIAPILAVMMLMPLVLIAQEIVRPDVAINYLEGTVRVQKPESEGWMTAESTMALVPGDKIQTSKKSRAELALAAHTIIRIDQNSTLDINKQTDSLLINPIFVQLTQGDFWGRILSPDSAFELICPLKSGNSIALTFSDTASSICRISIGPDSTFEARVYGGAIALTFSKPDSIRDSLNSLYYLTPNSALLKSSEKILLTSSGRMVFKGTFSPEDKDEKTDWVDWNKTRDSGASK
jgi:hypothetical protein